jgi:hypothetical protein
LWQASAIVPKVALLLVWVLGWLTVPSVADKRQMSIRSFFAPAAAPGKEDNAPVLGKRSRTEDGDLLASPAGNRSQHETPAKSASASESEVQGKTSSTSGLTQEQLDKIARNKAIALERKKETEAKNATAGAAVSVVSPPAVKTIMDAALAMPQCWKGRLQGEFDKPYFKKLCAFHSAQVLAKKVIFPPTQQVFSAFYACDFDKVSVVIVGQDPYHGPRQAHGAQSSLPSPRPPCSFPSSSPRTRLSSLSSPSCAPLPSFWSPFYAPAC